MNFYQDELTAQYNRQRVREEFELIRIEQHSVHSRAHRISLFTRTMHSFAGWMISTGKELHDHYEVPTSHHHKISKSFAR